MKKNKTILKYAICAGALCCILVSNVTFAANDFTIGQKAILTTKQNELAKLNIKENYTDNYIELNQQIAEIQRNLNENKDALKSLNKALKAAEELHGVNSPEAGHVHFKLTELYGNLFNPTAQQEHLEALHKAVKANPTSNHLKNLYYRMKAQYYNQYDQGYDALAATKEFSNYIESWNEFDKVFVSDQLGITKAALKQFKNAQLDFNNSYNLLLKNKNSNENNYINYYNMIMCYNLDQNNYAVIPNLYNKANSIIKGNDNNSKINKIIINSTYARYFRDLKYLDEALKLAQENENLARELNDTNIDYQIYNDYYLYYKQAKDFDKAKEYLNKKYALFKKLNANSTKLAYKDEYSDFFNLNKDIKNINKAEKYINKSHNIISNYKDLIPVVYANSLKDYADFMLNFKDKKVGLDYALKAKAEYDKYMPATSYKEYEINFLIGKAYSRFGEFDKSLTYYKAAENILINLQLVNTKDAIDLNEDYANLYFNKGDIKTCMSKLDKAINIAKTIYGPNNIKVYKLTLEKAKKYYYANQQDNAATYLDKISKAIKESKIKGQDSEFYFNYYMFTSQKVLNLGNPHEALKYTDLASKYCIKSDDKKSLDKLNSDIQKNLKNKI